MIHFISLVCERLAISRYYDRIRLLIKLLYRDFLSNLSSIIALQHLQRTLVVVASSGIFTCCQIWSKTFFVLVQSLSSFLKVFQVIWQLSEKISFPTLDPVGNHFPSQNAPLQSIVHSTPLSPREDMHRLLIESS